MLTTHNSFLILELWPRFAMLHLTRRLRCATGKRYAGILAGGKPFAEISLAVAVLVLGD
jgi:hypothetical protein